MSIIKKYNPIDLLPDVAVGIKLPFTGKSGNLFDLSYSTEEQALSNLKNLLLDIIILFFYFRELFLLSGIVNSKIRFDFEFLENT